MDEFERQISWVESLQGNQQILAGAVFHWQGIIATLQELIIRFKQVHDNAQPDPKKHWREVHIKKQIAGILYELDDLFRKWNGFLHGQNRTLESVAASKKTFDIELRKIGENTLHKIRNQIAFHFEDLVTKPQELVQMYRKLDSLSLDSIDRLHNAAVAYGEAMKIASIM